MRYKKLDSMTRHKYLWRLAGPENRPVNGQGCMRYQKVNGQGCMRYQKVSGAMECATDLRQDISIRCERTPEDRPEDNQL